MFKSSELATNGMACAIVIALCAACGDDSGSATSPTETGGTGATAGSTTTPSTTAGSAAAGRSGAAGSGAGRGAAGSSVAGSAGRAGSSGATAGTSANDDDAGVAGAGAAGAAGAAGGAGSAGASGSAAGASGAAAGSGGTGGTGAGATFTEVYAIFMTSCAGSSCHVSATRAGDMLSMADKATAYTNLVGVNSVSCSGEKRVVAGDPTKSELVHTLARTRIGNCTNTPRMPDGGRPMLPADQIEKVRSWVMAGALNN